MSVTSPFKSEFKTISPFVLNFKSFVGSKVKSTAPLKVTVLVVSTSIEPAVTVPVKVAPPSNLIFPSPISVLPETAFAPLKIRFALYEEGPVESKLYVELEEMFTIFDIGAV